MRKNSGFTMIELVVFIFVAVLLCVGPIGYVMNAVRFAKCDFKEPYNAEIVHGVGLVTPISIVTGYLNLGK